MSCCFLCQTQNHSSVRVTTSRKQERTKEERSVLLYNNRLICLLPFARKPDPRRVSKQVIREPPQAWLFGLVRFRAAGRTKSAAGKPIQRAAGRKITPSAAISLLFSLGFRSRCSRKAAPPAARCSQRTAERGRKLLHRSVCDVGGFFSFRRQGQKGGAPRRGTCPQAGGYSLGRPSAALRGRRR